MVPENDEALREAASVGNLAEINKLLQSGSDVNSTNKVNGWSALHWAAKRGHSKVVEALLVAGAHKDVRNSKGEIPADLTTKAVIRTLLGAPPVEEDGNQENSSCKFQPSYLSNPEFMYSKASHVDTSTELSSRLKEQRSDAFYFQPQTTTCTKGTQWTPCGLVIHPDVLVLCVRVANMSKMHNDFVEVEISRHAAPSLSQLTEILCESIDLGVVPEQVQKIRKLPRSILRTDRDVLRLTDYQELELVLQPDAVHPFDGSIVSPNQDSQAASDSRYLKNHVSKLVF